AEAPRSRGTPVDWRQRPDGAGADHGIVGSWHMMMNSRNWLPRAKRGWMLAGIAVIAAILLFLAAPPAHGAPCPHSQQGERTGTAQHEAVPDCCRGSRVVVPQCGRKSMAAGTLAAGPLPR